MQIADFGMSRDLQENYYVSQGGKIPVRWSAPEVCDYSELSLIRPPLGSVKLKCSDYWGGLISGVNLYYKA